MSFGSGRTAGHAIGERRTSPWLELPLQGSASGPYPSTQRLGSTKENNLKQPLSPCRLPGTRHEVRCGLRHGFSPAECPRLKHPIPSANVVRANPFCFSKPPTHWTQKKRVVRRPGPGPCAGQSRRLSSVGVCGCGAKSNVRARCAGQFVKLVAL